MAWSWTPILTSKCVSNAWAGIPEPWIDISYLDITIHSYWGEHLELLDQFCKMFLRSGVCFHKATFVKTKLQHQIIRKNVWGLKTILSKFIKWSWIGNFLLPWWSIVENGWRQRVDLPRPYWTRPNTYVKHCSARLITFLLGARAGVGHWHTHKPVLSSPRCTLKWHQGTWAERKSGIASCPKAYALPPGPVGLGRASGYCLGCRAQLDRLMWA